MSKKTTGCDHWKTLITTNNAKTGEITQTLKWQLIYRILGLTKMYGLIYIYLFISVFLFSMPEQSRFTVIFCTTVVHMLPYLTITRIRCSHYLMPEKNGGWRQFFFFMHFWRETIKKLFHFFIPVNHWIESNNECTLEMIYKPHIHWSSNNDAKKNHHGPMHW